MSYLDNIETTPDDRPVICTITGDAGMGKTRFANTFPRPIFIRVEDGLQSIPRDIRPNAFPVVQSPNDVYAAMNALLKEDHGYKTLVIDSVTQLDTLFTDHILANDPKKPNTLAQAHGGYGAGYQALSGMHGRVRKGAEMLNKLRGMHVVFIAHAETTTIELPDQDPYTRYDIRIHKKSVSHYVDNVDLVGHIKLETFTRGEGERKQAVSDGTRLLVCYAAAAQVSKNRYGIEDDLILPLDTNVLVDYIPTLEQNEKLAQPETETEESVKV